MNEELRSDLELLLENSELDKSNHFSVNMGPFSIGGVSESIYLNENEFTKELSHSHSKDISKIFYQQNKTVQSEIKTFLLTQLPQGGQVSYSVVNIFVEIGAFHELLDYLIENFEKRPPSHYDTLRQINRVLFLFWDSFTKAEIKQLRVWCGNVINGNNTLGESLKPPFSTNLLYKVLFNSIHKQTNRILVIDVRRRISLGFNPEINIDQEKLKEEFARFGFPTDLSQALDKVDQKMNSSKDAFDFKGCMDLLRSFTERLYRSVLDQFGPEGKAVKEQDSEQVVKFFKKNGLVGDDFGNMIISQRHFLSNLASHRLKSREEDARLSKNMTIELSMYLLRRFQNH